MQAQPQPGARLTPSAPTNHLFVLVFPLSSYAAVRLVSELLHLARLHLAKKDFDSLGMPASQMLSSFAMVLTRGSSRRGGFRARATVGQE